MKNHILRQAIACLAVSLWLPLSSRADLIAYDNTTTLTGIVQFNGATNFGGNTMTAMNADDLTVASGFGGSAVSSFTFIAYYNASSGTVTARPSFYFWAANGAGGGPGTFLDGLTLNPMTFTAQQVTPIHVASVSGLTIPTDGKLWAGIVYDDDFGTTGASAAQLNQLGGPLYGPPTVGSSQDIAVFSLSGSYAVNNPSVTFFNFGGNPPLDYGWQLTTTVPEPSSAATSTACALLAIAVALWHRRHRGA
jgi:hypothetical protein